jgi:uncharacterized SAM-binding protein YcdF (DUF218 family)
MGQSKFIVFRFLLFLFGLAILSLACFFITEGKEQKPEDIFIWVSVFLIYLVLFCPFFFSVWGRTVERKIPSLSLVWGGIFVYTFVSIGLILLLKFSVGLINVKVALVIQSIIVFLFLVNIYFAYFANFHAAKVASGENQQRQYLEQLKDLAASLALKAGSCPEGKEEFQKKIKKAAEDIRYISPVAGGRGTELETRLIDKTRLIGEMWDTLLSGGDSPQIRAEINSLDLLIKERKQLRN